MSEQDTVVRDFNLSRMQHEITRIPHDVNVYMGGGRAGGKTEVIPTLVWQHCEDFGEQAKVVVLRRQWRELEQIQQLFVQHFATFLGTGNIKPYWNKQNKKWTLPNGATVLFAQLDTLEDYEIFHGASFTLQVWEELPLWGSPVLFDKMQSTLRGPDTVLKRLIATGNPGLAGHSWNYERFARHYSGEQFTLFQDKVDGKWWVYVHSTYLDNPFLPEGYEKQFFRLMETDPALAECWITGSWEIASGNYFAASMDRRRNCVPEWLRQWRDRHNWRFIVAGDHGSDAPAAFALGAIAQDSTLGGDGHSYVAGDVVIVSELHSAKDNDVNKGKGWGVEELAERLHEWLLAWHLPRDFPIYMDDAIFADLGVASIADEYTRYGVNVKRARKGQRVAGWELLRDKFSKAMRPKEREWPALYYTTECPYLETCFFALKHDETNREDVSNKSTDPTHMPDAVRYLMLNATRPPEGTVITAAPWTPGWQPPVVKKRMEDPAYRERLVRQGVHSINLTSGTLLDCNKDWRQ